MGVNPVWYVGMRWGQDAGLWAALVALREEAQDSGYANATAKALPFIEPMYDFREHGGGRHEFWWEREWRHLGDFSFDWPDVALIIAPEVEHALLESKTGRRCINGSWSLERVIAHLARAPEGQQETPMAR